jgi:hypothetical protein
MHAANIDKSYRLKRVLEFLALGPGTTRQISRSCDVYAVNSIVAELRANGYTISCTPVKGQRGVYQYALQGSPCS